MGYVTINKNIPSIGDYIRVIETDFLSREYREVALGYTTKVLSVMHGDRTCVIVEMFDGDTQCLRGCDYTIVTEVEGEQDDWVPPLNKDTNEYTYILSNDFHSENRPIMVGDFVRVYNGSSLQSRYYPIFEGGNTLTLVEYVGSSFLSVFMPDGATQLVSYDQVYSLPYVPN